MVPWVGLWYVIVTFIGHTNCNKGERKYLTPGPKVIKHFACSSQLSTKFQLIKTKITTNNLVSCFKSLKLYLSC